MTKKIFTSIFAVTALVMISCLSIVMGVLFHYFETMQKKQLAVQCNLVEQGVLNQGADYFSELKTGDYRVTWIDSDGEVLYDNGADITTMENHAQRKEIREAFENGSGDDERYSITMMKKTIYHAQLLSDGTVIRMSVDKNSVWGLLLGMTQPIGLVILFAVVFSFIIAYGISKKIVEPLNQLNLDQPLENETYEELSPLLERIEKQHRRIQEQMSQLEQKREEFAAITEGMSEGLILLGKGNVILSMNTAAQKLLNTDTACFGKNILTVYRNTRLQSIIEPGWTDVNDSVIIEITGREYQWNVSAIKNEGTIAGICLLVFDVTEKVQAERIRREFTANVSHELKTPLQSIMGTAELIENGLMKPEDQPHFAGRIREEARNLVTLIDDIIRLSQLDEGGDFLKEEVNIYDLSTEVVESLGDVASKNDVTLTVEGDTQAIVLGVRRLLQEIVFNLCDNAIKYNKPKGKVLVTIAAKKSEVALRVQDTGLGIPREHQTRIFERFYRVDKSHSRATGGTGLGLSIVKHAAEYHHATMQLKSDEGIGTAITILFPAEC